ncbi:MAG TPA: amino acid deaminase/aldolase [Nocardioidaceae bacterium]|nr:amino acid deaminase/aldolase [Nocardioidaceae bacterium]
MSSPGSTRTGIDADIDRHRLATRLGRAVAGLAEPPCPPVAVVDRDAFDANAADLVRRAGGKPVRLATKSLRIPALGERALAVPGFHGVLAYTLREALWLFDAGVCDDIVMGYPSVDRVAIRRLCDDPAAARAITLMIDDPAHLEVVTAVRGPGKTRIRVAIDIDAGLRLGPARVGPRRSPLYDVEPVVALARDVVRRRAFDLVGVMTYEGQVAGVPDRVPGRPGRSLVVRTLKSASVSQIHERRARLAGALSEVTRLQFWNAGGSGSIETSSHDPAVTEVTAGSGLLGPTLFDHYACFTPQPAAFFGLPVVRRPALDCVTVAGGGLIASGPAGRTRSPTPWAPPGLRLTATEGAGEVQTPLVGATAASLALGDLVWFRHAKSGELAEHVRRVHVVSGDAVVDRMPTYRGTGNAW